MYLSETDSRRTNRTFLRDVLQSYEKSEHSDKIIEDILEHESGNENDIIAMGQSPSMRQIGKNK